MMRAAMVLFVLCVLVAPVAAYPDTVKLKSGEELEGMLAAESFTIATSAEGTLVIPVSSIASLTFGDGDAVTVTLLEGQELEGRFEDSEILLDRGLYSSKLAPADVAQILVEERVEMVTLPRGTTVRMMLAESLTSATAEKGDDVRFCLFEPVEIAGRTVLPRGWPGIGAITASRGAGEMSRRGRLALEPKYLLDGGGGRIAVTGSGEFSGGLKPGNFVAGGLLGFLGSGDQAQAPAGALFEAETEEQAQLSTSAMPRDPAAWDHCREFFRFTDGGTVPLDEVELKSSYAPFGNTLSLRLPLTGLEAGQSRNRSLRNLLVFDTYIQTLRIATAERRRKVRLDLTFVLVVYPSHDKRVDLKVAVVAGDEVLDRDEDLRVDAEEKKSKFVYLSLEVDKERYAQLKDSEEFALTIDMNVWE